MENFYQAYAKGYAEKIKNYITSTEFKDFFKSVNGEYLYREYFDRFITFTLGGKCLRGYAVDLFFRLFGGTDETLSIKAAVCFELFESSVLMHDDVFDRGRVRRGKPSAYVALGDNHAGEARAICLGDAGFFTAVALLHSDERLTAVAPFITRIFLRTISGELADIDLAEKTEIADNEVIAAYLEKTASYTMLGPSVTGALLAGANLEHATDLLRDFALQTGLAFQIKDDLLGIFEEQEKIGKAGNSDIAEGKKSLLVSHFDQKATEEQKTIFYSIYGKGTPDKDSEKTIKKLFEETGARAYAEQAMNDAFSAAEKHLDDILESLSPPEKTAKELSLFIGYLKTRTK